METVILNPAEQAEVVLAGAAFAQDHKVEKYLCRIEKVFQRKFLKSAEIAQVLHITSK